jgi:SAM-dependent methyltransferase
MTSESQGMDWQAWHRDYDDPDSPVSRRLAEVRTRLTADLAARPGRVRLLSLCSGDARDTIPVVAASDREVSVCLVELDPSLAAAARQAADEAAVEVDVRTGDAGDPTTYADVLPVDVLLLVGVLGNVSDADAQTTVAAAASMVAPGGTVLWTRSDRFRSEPTHDMADPAAWVRGLFESRGFETLAYVVPDEGHWRLGVSRLTTPSQDPLPGRLFTFVR